MGNTKTNINSTKVLVDKYNTQMTTQKKISKASEDPVIAIRSLRLSTSLSHLDQYKDNNIPDASSWMDVTETALSNMKSLLTDIRTQCVNGSTDTLTADDRNTILQQLTALSEQVYTEGNADYAGRTVFTGYRTSSKLTFQKDTKSTYQITQEFSAADLSEKRYYTNGVTVPNSINAATPDCTTDVTEHSFQRIRLGYGNTTDDVKLSIDGKELTPGTDYTVYKSVSDFDPSKLSADDTAYIQETGEFVFIVGKSGSGKSTLIKLLLKELDPTSGKIYVNKKYLNKITRKKLPYLRRDIGVVFQDFRLLPDRNVYENIAFAQKVVEAPNRKIKSRVLAMLSMVGLLDKYKAFPNELSGGEQQRIAIARALVNKPAILLCDEPTGNLDPANSNEIMKILNQVNKQGTTVLVVTHNMEIVQQMKKRTITMSEGKIISDQEKGGYFYED